MGKTTARLGVMGLLAAAPCLPDVGFNRDIRPIMSDTCFRCHGPDRSSRMAGLRLDIREEATRARSRGTPIVPGDPDRSLVVSRILSEDPRRVMPPPAAHKSLTQTQKDTIRRWISEGAPYEEHWSYQPVRRPDVPRTDGATHPIDAFVRERLAKAGLQPSSPADARTLIRRVYLDLTGLPPTANETAAFVRSPTRRAYELLLDPLLSSPHFAERQTQFWLDAVRFADTSGFHGDNTFPVWPYRDYVLRSFQSNKPFDQFTREQIAGDLVPESTREQRLATAFHRLHRSSAEGGIQPKEYLAKYASDRVRTTSAVWLGMTMGCAECHDHKFDPISARDFYSFKAFFADIDEEGFVPVKGPKAWGRLLRLPDSKQEREWQDIEARLAGVDQERLRRFEAEKARREAWFSDVLDRWRKGEFAWQRQRPVRAASTGGAILSISNEDGTESVELQNGTTMELDAGEGLVTASGQNPDRATYTVVFQPGQGDWTTLGLEVVPDDALPGLGFARGADRFVITEISMEADGRQVPFVLATDNLINYHAGLPPAAAIDNDPATGWGLPMYQDARSPFLALRFAEPLRTTVSSQVTVRIRQDSEVRRATIGKFRLALSPSTSMPMTTFKANADNPARPHLLGVPSSAIDALRKPADQRTPADEETLRGLYAYMQGSWQPLEVEGMRLKARRSILDAAIPKAVTTVSTEPRETRLLPRGNWMDDSGPVVEPAIPSKLGELSTSGRATRLDLANWLVSNNNPLTSRVIVNRVWKQLFGAGLSRRLDDLGSQGEPPTHPELLDWLASEFMKPEWNADRTHAWDYRHLVRTILLSDTYRQSSTATKELESRDPDNRLLARQSRFRIDAESVRDTALAVSGLLQEGFGGPSIFPYQPDGYLAALNYPKREHAASHGADLYRRSLYVHWQRTFLHPSLLAFDAPSREECTVARTSSNTPLQALVLLNDPIFVEAARVLAERAHSHGGASPSERIAWAFRQTLGRRPMLTERRLLADLYAESFKAYAASGDAVRRVLAAGEAPRAGSDLPEVAAMLSVTRVILNLHETITRN